MWIAFCKGEVSDSCELSCIWLGSFSNEKEAQDYLISFLTKQPNFKQWFEKLSERYLQKTKRILSINVLRSFLFYKDNDLLTNHEEEDFLLFWSKDKHLIALDYQLGFRIDEVPSGTLYKFFRDCDRADDLINLHTMLNNVLHGYSRELRSSVEAVEEFPLKLEPKFLGY